MSCCPLLIVSCPLWVGGFMGLDELSKAAYIRNILLS